MFNQYVPEEVGFINELLDEEKLREIIGDIIKITSMCRRQLSSWMISRHLVSVWPSRVVCHLILMILSFLILKKNCLSNAKGEVDEVWDNYNMGLITNNERYNQIIDIWTRVDTRITETLMRELAADKQGFNSVYMMLDSGARGSKQQIKQLGWYAGV